MSIVHKRKKIIIFESKRKQSEKWDKEAVMVKLVNPRSQNPLSHWTSVLLPYSSYNSYLKNIYKIKN